MWELERTHGIECSECGKSHCHGFYFVEYEHKNFLSLFKIPYSNERKIECKCSSCLESYNGKEIKRLPKPDNRNAVIGF